MGPSETFPGSSQPGVASAGHFEAIVESSDDAILSKDRNAVITSWNPAATRLYGYPPEEAIGRPISILIPEHRAGEELEILDRVLKGERIEHYETERLRRDGTLVAISLTVSPIHAPDEDSIEGASMIARDITDKRRAAERAARLQGLSTELAKTLAPEEVVDVALREAISTLGADAGAVGLLEEDGETIRVAGYSGYSDASISPWETFSVSDELPMAEVVRTGEPIWSVGRQALVDRYRALTDGPLDHGTPEFHSRAIVPVSVGDQIFGAVSLSFRSAQSFQPGQRDFLVASAQQAAYALERARLHAAEQTTRRNLDFLAQASELFAQSLDVQTTVDRVASFTVPRLADWCIVDLVEDRGIDTAAVAGADPAKVELADRLRGRHPGRFDAQVGAAAVIRSGLPALYPTIPQGFLEAAEPDDERREVLRELGPVSAMIVPLNARAQTLGALSLLAADSGREFTPDDLRIAEDLARRAALAVENSTLYAREHRAAIALQRSLLPAELPDLPGFQLAARYLPAGAGIDVGGDWYDTIELPNGLLHLVVGDVAGRGTRAASIMGQLRTALRAYVLDGYSPSEAVARLNRLARAFERSEMATVIHLCLDVRTREATCVRAGHTPPLVRRPDGEVTELAIEGSLPIGVQQESFPTTRFEIEPGSVMLLYTDGLVESRTSGLRPGLEKLKRALGSAPAQVEACADYVLQSLRPAETDDDVALLAVRLDRLGEEPLD